VNAATRRYLDEEIEELEAPVALAVMGQTRSAAKVAGRPARVMIADDDPEMRSMLASALRRDGYDVVEATGGAALLEEWSMLLFRGEPFPADVIVSDERMPGMPGLEILAGLRSARWPTPFILITGFGDEAIHERANRLGATAVFDKPFDLGLLRDTIRSALLTVRPTSEVALAVPPVTDP
jgi:CheY-like chemotaxis protein